MPASARASPERAVARIWFDVVPSAISASRRKASHCHAPLSERAALNSRPCASCSEKGSSPCHPSLCRMSSGKGRLAPGRLPCIVPLPMMLQRDFWCCACNCSVPRAAGRVPRTENSGMSLSSWLFSAMLCGMRPASSSSSGSRSGRVNAVSRLLFPASDNGSSAVVIRGISRSLAMRRSHSTNAACCAVRSTSASQRRWEVGFSAPDSCKNPSLELSFSIATYALVVPPAFARSRRSPLAANSPARKRVVSVDILSRPFRLSGGAESER